jgi:hypothetical protein
MNQKPISIRNLVTKAVADVKITDMHTHLYSPAFGSLAAWGVDELLTYHYLVAETFRWIDISYDTFWAMSKPEQADLIWQTLFIEHSPISESCRGVLTVFNRFGLDASCRDLNTYRSFFRTLGADEYFDRVFELAGLESVVMTNDPFDNLERPLWLAGVRDDKRFPAALRLDDMVNLWDTAVPKMREWGFDVTPDLGVRTVDEVRRFLAEWIERINPVYMAISLPPTFEFPNDSAVGRLIDKCVLPVSRETGVPLAMMIGVKRLTNPQLRMAGDSMGRSHIEAVEHLCSNYPDNKFFVTMLARENVHELCATARKFRNLMIFGCWWFLNNPSLIDEITRMRLELLGLSMIPQHSDARVLDQLIYKWGHSRKIVGEALADKYEDLAATGWNVTEDEVKRDVHDLFSGNFWRFVK